MPAPAPCQAGVARHGAHVPPLALTAIPALDGPLQGHSAHSVKHVQTQPISNVAHLPLVQRRAPVSLPATT